MCYTVIITRKEDDKMNANQRSLAKKAQEETLNTLKQIDDNVWIMNYKCS